MNNITKIGIKSLYVMLFILLLTTAHAAATIVSIANVTAEPGDTVTLPIMINDITDYGSGTIRIWYDHLVVHVTNIAGSPNSSIAATYTDNSIGYTAISASNLYGASGDIAFANVVFTAVGSSGDSTQLNLTVASLYDNAPLDIPRSVNNGSITVRPAEPPKPFSIYGYVRYENGTPCINPMVNITNLNTYKEWQTETSGGSNYYNITLTTDSDLNASEILRFDATDGTNSNVTDHTVTAGEVDSGGLIDFNLTLGPPTDPAPYLTTYTISNTTISPNGDGIEDDTEIDVKFSESVDAAIRIENATGVIKTMYTGSGVTDHPQTWDGTDDSSDIVADGAYQVNVTMDDGVNPMVYDNTRSITVILGTITSVSIADITAEPGDTVMVPLMINDMTDYGTGTINITYNSSVVHVTDVTSSSDSTVAAFNNNNAIGHTAISASNFGGASGDIVFANVEFTAVGSSGDSTLLNLDVVSLYDRSFNAIPTIVNNGSFTIQSSADPAPYLVTYTISNTTISPNGDGIEDDTTIDAEFSETVSATIKIENATGIIQTLYTSASIKNPDPQTWNGTDDAGNIVANGTYYINITMEDGVNPLVYNNTRSISVTKGTIISVFITDVTVATGDTVTIPIRIDGIIDYGTGTTNLTYNSTVVHVTDVTSSPDSTVTAKNIDNTTGLVRISAWNTGGVSGDIVFANVIFTAIGIGTTPLNLTVDTLQDIAGLEIPVTIDNGSITIDTTLPTITITSPTDGQTFTTCTITVNGTASDNVGLSKVEVKVGSGSWQTAFGTTSWTASVTLASGSNTIYARATDTSGNTKETSVTVTYNPPDTTAPVVNTVTLNTITPNTGDAILVTVNATDDVEVTSVTAGDVELTYQSGTIWTGTITAIAETHSVNVSAKDAAGNTGWNNSTSYTATTPDTTAPVVNAVVNGTPSASSVTITWTTDEASDSVVKYGTATGTYTDSKSDTARVTSHSITLTELDSSTTYYFVVNSTDASDNSAQSAEHNFTTAAANGSITGKVTDSATGLSIEGATVTADGVTTETNSEGGYTISLKAGTYTVSVNKTGYVDPTSESVVVTAGLPTTVNFVLVRDYVELELKAGETIIKVGNANEDISFNLTVTNHGDPAAYSVINSSTSAKVDIYPNATGVLLNSNTRGILVTINASINGSYPVIISAINGSKSAEITIVALALDRDKAGTNDSNSVTNNSELLNGTLVQNNSAVNDSTVTSSVVDNSAVNDSTVTSSVVDNSAVNDANVTDSFLYEDTNVTDGEVTGSTLTNATTTGTNVTDSEIEDSTTFGGTIDGSTVTDSNTAGTDVTSSDLTNVNATGGMITDVTLQNIELTNATVWNKTGVATIKGDGAKVNTSGDGGVEVYFENVYEDIPVEDLIKNQTDPKQVSANVTATTDAAEAAKVGASLSLNSTAAGNVTISRCGISPGGSTFAMTGLSGNIVGDYIHISHDLPEDAEVNVTLVLYYGTAEPGDTYITWYNETTHRWDPLLTTKFEEPDGWYLRVANLNHLSTFAFVTVSTPSVSGRRGGTYPPGWFATPTVTPSEEVVPTPTKPVAEETPTPAPSPAIASVARTPVEEGMPEETPEQVMESRTEQPPLPPPISSPIAGIVIVAVAAIFGIVMVTRATEDRKKATIATIGIVIVAVAAIIGMMLM